MTNHIVIDLVIYCERENVPFVTFDDWSFIHSTVKDIVEGRTTCGEVAKKGNLNK
jgi:2-hydroxy-3-keto-5-methylthiopentenyl-1-phosphate phosphatase